MVTDSRQRFDPRRRDFKTSPMIVFYEVTQACGLVCKHCRACAQTQADPNELNNVLILRRCEVPVVVAEALPTPAPATPPVTGVPTQPEGPETPEDSTPLPGEKPAPSPLDKIDLDTLDLDDAEEAAIRIDR